MRGTLPLAGLHDVIQTVFGWTDSHLHQFVIAGRTYGQPDDFDEAVEDESAITLARAVGTRTKHFLYRASAPPVTQLFLTYIRNGYSIGAWRRRTRRKLH